METALRPAQLARPAFIARKVHSTQSSVLEGLSVQRAVEAARFVMLANSVRQEAPNNWLVELVITRLDRLRSVSHVQLAFSASTAQFHQRSALMATMQTRLKRSAQCAPVVAIAPNRVPNVLNPVQAVLIQGKASHSA